MLPFYDSFLHRFGASKKYPEGLDAPFATMIVVPTANLTIGEQKYKVTSNEREINFCSENNIMAFLDKNIEQIIILHCLF